MNTSKKDEAIESLREILKAGDTIHTILRHVSRSGMSRVIDLKFITESGDVRHIGYSAAVALGYNWDDKRQGVKIGGCGMDMGFHLVYSLSRILFPDGFGVEGDYPNGSKGRPTSKSMAAGAVAIGAEFFGRNGDKSGWDSDGGYALRHRWI